MVIAIEDQVFVGIEVEQHVVLGHIVVDDAED